MRRKREPDEDDLNVVQPDLVVICDYRKDLYMESGIKECWIVDPVNRSITIHAFRDFELVESRVALEGRPMESVCFPGLMVRVERILG